MVGTSLAYELTPVAPRPALARSRKTIRGSVSSFFTCNDSFRMLVVGVPLLFASSMLALRRTAPPRYDRVLPCGLRTPLEACVLKGYAKARHAHLPPST